MRTITNKLTRSSSLSLIFGCIVLSIWTLIRFFNRGPNFDQVGQLVLAHQWLHGLHSGSVIGPTNYVLKMLLLYMPLDLIPLPAQFKLVFITLIINIATFLLLAYTLRRIWLEFYPGVKNSFYFPLIYLALISGSVYWISFANSRNLEVAAGVWLIYLYIKAQSAPSRHNFTAIVIFGSLLFFADPLQIYMTLLPALAFLGLRTVVKPSRPQTTVLLKVAGCALLSILLARLLKISIEAIWNVSFINAKQSVAFTLSSLKLSLQQMARLYGGGYEGGRLREATNLLVVAAGLLGATYYAWRKPKSRWLLSLAALVWLVDLGVYIMSGQAQQADTNRYLIMTVPMFILVLALVLYYMPPKPRMYVVSLVLLLNTITLAGAFLKSWNPSFSNNNHDSSVIKYFKDHHYSYGYASINTALSSDYLSKAQVNILPIGCDPDYVLKKTNLFFDKAAFSVKQQSPANALIPIVLDGNNIKINSSVCGVSQISAQLGRPLGMDYLNDGSTVLFYRANQLPHLRAVSSVN